MYTTDFMTYFLDSLKIFLLAFIIGKSIDNVFIYIQIQSSVDKHSKSLIFGILQLFVVIIAAYYLHTFTSNQFSDEMQIYAPNVLFSSFIFALQTNIIKNLELITIRINYN